MTGGAGFIGSHIVDSLLARDIPVVVLDDLSTGKRGNLPEHHLLDFHLGSIVDEKLVNLCVAGCSHIFDLAAVVSVQDSIKDPRKSHDVNLTATVNLLEAAKRQQAKFVFASSAAVYGNNDRSLQKEGEESDPISPYGVQKRASEHYIKIYNSLYDVQGVCFRQFNVYGPRQDPTSPYSGVISIFAKSVQEGKDLYINGDGLQTRDFIFVGDVVNCYLRALEPISMKGQSLNIGTGKETTIKMLAESIVNATPGATSSIIHREAVAGDIRNSCANTEFARSSAFLTDSFIPLEEGIARTLEWYRT